ncbi:putative D-arabinono-1,4-lactone oxidase [Lachnellula subtilissima]|uniref:D-arabinono-1,4-lactone oxidase n=1 Tax=Lachnellula subtilissima TaxID=602034 RepID=A0A8H8RIR8_9HELO|nr:putative D-arabinono-1,4-lactone oxidase [Lachnellula subtilissima]
MDPSVQHELSKLSETDSIPIPFRASPNHIQSTWARTFHFQPSLYIRPRTLPELERAVTLARLCRKHITTIGCGHSPSSITSTSSWLINLDDYNKILDVDRESGVVRMESGIRLYQIGEELDKVGLAMPNLGSINQQSIAGAISTGTHGSSLRHGLLSASILSLKITLASGKTETCSPTQNEELFRAALISLGALGVISELTFQAVPAFTLRWKQVVDRDVVLFEDWPKQLWTQAEFVRVWWFPYTRRGVVWTAEKTEEEPKPPAGRIMMLGWGIIFTIICFTLDSISLEFCHGWSGSSLSGTTTSAIQPSREALLMNCLYSQFVNEWALPLHKGPEALRRLSSWLNQLSPSDPDYIEHGIPYTAEGLYVHAPVEVRVTDTAKSTTPRPHLDPTCTDEPTLYLNATIYRPYDSDPPCRFHYYQGFEYLMKELGGRPHWAKNFEVGAKEIESMYGDRLVEWKRIRENVDPEGMFVGEWHRHTLLGEGKQYALEEREVGREIMKEGGLLVKNVVGAEEKRLSGYSSEESFDEMRASEITIPGRIEV